MKKLRLVTILLGCCLCFSAYGQRTARFQSFIDAQYALSLPSARSGAYVGYGMYLKQFYWTAGASFVTDVVSLSNGCRLDMVDYYGGGGFYFRPLSTRDRSFNVYVGARVLLGAEVMDPASKLDRTLKTLPDGTVLEGGRFIYGGAPEVVLEWFPLQKVALVVSGGVPFVGGSLLGVVRYQVNAGVRVNL